MGSDALLFFVILVMFFGLWLVSGGPTKPISFAGPYITPVTDVGVTQKGYGTLNLHPVSISGSTHITSPSSVERSLNSAYDSLADLQKKAADLKLYGEPSPYKDMVSLGRVSATGKVSTEYVTISASHSADQDITITGWKLVSAATGNTATIGQGTDLPRTGDVNQTAPIVLHPGDTAVLADVESPLGVSFRENECVGYLNQYQHFTVNLPNECPAAYGEYEDHYTGNQLNDGGCYQVMRNTSRCQVPTDRSGLSSACYAVIDKYLNYNGCVASHRYDPDFTGDTWHIYFNRDTDDDPLWKQSREAVRLVDQNGKTVDVYEY